MGSYWSGYLIIGVEVALLLLLIIVGYYLIQRRHKLLLEEKALRFKPVNNQSLQELIDQAKKQKLNAPLDVALSKGVYSLDKELQISAPVRLIGLGVSDTRVVAKGSRTAMNISNVKDCSVSNMTIQGKIECYNSELEIENCQIVANEDGICIEAKDGSTVTVSGMLRGEGGIAIRAQGESKVILKQPYVISGDDYMVRDPKSTISIEPVAEAAPVPTDSRPKPKPAT